MINIFHHSKEIATLKKDNKYILKYNSLDFKDSIALSLPNTQKLYISQNLIPYFDTILPEGYLFETLKKHLIKEFGYFDEFLLLTILAPNIESRIKYKSNIEPNKLDIDLYLEDILNDDSKDRFNYLVNKFLYKSAIGGVQPKSIAILKDKKSLNYKKYIIKRWDDEFKYLAQNEYLTMQTVKLADIEIPNIYLSKNKNFLVIERFDNENLAFEEVISLLGKLKYKKYSGSYEQVAKIIYKYSSNPTYDMEKFFKIVVMNYLLKNGDAHLKNFGLLFNDDFSKISLAPAYDIVTTTAYIFRDKPALMLNGKKIWHNINTLIEFGVNHCYLSREKAKSLADKCISARDKGINLIKEHISKNKEFETIGKRMIDSWSLSIEKEYKEIPLELIKNWKREKI